jgi:hypothetical protein
LDSRSFKKSSRRAMSVAYLFVGISIHLIRLVSVYLDDDLVVLCRDHANQRASSLVA